MPTFMTPTTFASLTSTRDCLNRDVDPPNGMSNIFVPWAGSGLKEKRGIYFVGIALNAEPASADQSFNARLKSTEGVCLHNPSNVRNSPFWCFFNGLTSRLLNGSYLDTSARWGWSNLLKLAWSEGEPKNWPSDIKKGQREVSIAALQEEFENLHQCLVFIGSGGDYDVLYPVVGDKELWNKEKQDETGLWWLKDKKSENLFIHGYHPKPMKLEGIFDAALDAAVKLTTEHLPAF
jgi:hypothetical protein